MLIEPGRERETHLKHKAGIGKQSLPQDAQHRAARRTWGEVPRVPVYHECSVSISSCLASHHHMPPRPTSVATLPWSAGLASTSCSSVPILSPTRKEFGDVSKLGACTRPMMLMKCPGFANTTLFSRTCFHLWLGGRRARRCRVWMWFLHFPCTVGKALTPDSLILTHRETGSSDVTCLLRPMRASNKQTQAERMDTRVALCKSSSLFLLF